MERGDVTANPNSLGSACEEVQIPVAEWSANSILMELFLFSRCVKTE